MVTASITDSKQPTYCCYSHVCLAITRSMHNALDIAEEQFGSHAAYIKYDKTQFEMCRCLKQNIFFILFGLYEQNETMQQLAKYKML